MSKRSIAEIQMVTNIPEALEPNKGADYGRFWYLINNRELIVFTIGFDAYNEQLVACFPHMPPDKARSYCDALITLFK